MEMALRVPNVVLTVAPANREVEALTRGLLALGVVPVRATGLRHARAITSAVHIDLAVVESESLDHEPCLADLLDTVAVPLVLVGSHAAEPPGPLLTVLDADAEPFEVAVAVERLARSLDEGRLHWGNLTLDLRQRSAQLDGLDLPLTPTQFRIMATLAHARGEVVSRPELCRRSFGAYRPGDGERLDAHLRRIRRLLEGAPAGRDFLVTVRGEGVRLADRRARPRDTEPAAVKAVVPAQAGERELSPTR